MKTIDLYLSIAAASGKMVAAARSGDWDALVSAEEECAHRIAILKAHQESGAPQPAGRERQQRVDILGRILAHDAEIRELAMPWLAQLENMLSGANNGRRVGNAYRSDFG